MDDNKSLFSSGLKLNLFNPPHPHPNQYPTQHSSSIYILPPHTGIQGNNHVIFTVSDGDGWLHLLSLRIIFITFHRYQWTALAFITIIV